MSYRTDLAMEATEYHKKNLPNGVAQAQRTVGNLSISDVHIQDQEGAHLLGKTIGHYITVTVPPLYSSIELTPDELQAIADEINTILPQEGLILVVGLGNNDITPDAVGPRTVHQILATRHISGEIAIQNGFGSLRAIATIAPGVLGQTGIETSEIIHAIVEDIKPVAVIVIDALAARSVTRLGTTIQIADCGISPGSGVMNRRKELSTKTLGIPVVSIGIPTVVDAATLAGDLLEEDEDNLERRKQLFEPEGRSMMITPREIDLLISHACNVLAMSINKALHPDMTFDEIGYLTR